VLLAVSPIRRTPFILTVVFQFVFLHPVAIFAVAFVAKNQSEESVEQDQRDEPERRGIFISNNIAAPVRPAR
jgi:hypothetical protein